MKKLLTSREVAAMLGIAEITVREWRYKGKGPKFIKLEGTIRGHVRYDPDDVQAYIDKYSVQPAAEVVP